MIITDAHGADFELTRVHYTYLDDTTVQEGILVRVADDPTDDGVLYGNLWTVDAITDTDDLENLFSSGDGTVYFHKAFDGTYHIDA